VFYTSRNSRPPADSDVKVQRQAVLADHQELLRLIRSRDAEGAEDKAREDMRLSGDRYVKAMIARDIAGS
jgi:DNA-binding GntR family transcriptional regulator